MSIMWIIEKIAFYSIAIVLCINFTGCGATHAEIQSQALKESLSKTMKVAKACMAAVYNKDENELLRPHTPLNFDIKFASIQQLTDKSYMSEDQKSALYVVHPMMQECRMTALNDLTASVPTMVPIAEEQMAYSEENLIRLVKKQITWGQYTKNAKDWAALYSKKFRAEADKINSQLEQSKEAELAQRQAAITAIANLVDVSAQVALAVQEQRAIDKINKQINSR